jgi:rod shape-determining protein MreC
MRNLFLLLWRNNFFILFLVLETFCGYLIFQNKSFHHSSFVNSTNVIATKVNGIVNNVTEYIDLKTANEALSRENAALKMLLPDVYYIDSVIERTNKDTILKLQYSFISAKVINNSVNRRNNYLTLNKGSVMGIKPEMGVICSDGIVGIVKDVSDHFCSVMSFLHKDAKISAKIKKNGFIGSLVWDGFDENHASLKDIAKHVQVSKGDTIITSSYSSIFPEGVMLGIVEEVNASGGNNFQEIKLKLSTTFGKLSNVYIVNNLFKDEQRALEEPLKGDR